MFKVKIGDELLLAEKGELLSEVLIKYGKYVEHPCGGRGVCGKCKALVDGRMELSCLYRIYSDVCVELPLQENIYSETGASGDICVKAVGARCLCLDIGTTTLALALIDVDEKNVIKVITATNPQRMLGADVISRIDYCGKNGIDKLHNALVEKINEMSAEFCLDKDIALFVAGNVTMLHTFFGVDCTALGVAPYNAEFLDSKNVDGKKLGLNNINEVISLPAVHTFFGSDLVAGINYTGLPGAGRYSLLVDLGTNAEIVLYSEKEGFCTSAAAGPCFEGANISCGMSATAGAIIGCEYSDGRFCVETIGGIAPKGICGTGLIDVIACLLDNGTIDKTGYMGCEEIKIAPDIYVTQKDVRQYQLAKSAVKSGIKTLVEEAGIGLDDIQNVYISGGFSTKINLENAVKTGLLPEELKGDCVVLNNSSLLGTAKFACGQNYVSQYINKIKYVDLSCNPIFSELFIENMDF